MEEPSNLLALFLLNTMGGSSAHDSFSSDYLEQTHWEWCGTTDIVTYVTATSMRSAISGTHTCPAVVQLLLQHNNI